MWTATGLDVVTLPSCRSNSVATYSISRGIGSDAPLAWGCCWMGPTNLWRAFKTRRVLRTPLDWDLDLRGLQTIRFWRSTGGRHLLSRLEWYASPFADCFPFGRSQRQAKIDSRLKKQQWYCAPIKPILLVPGKLSLSLNHNRTNCAFPCVVGLVLVARFQPVFVCDPFSCSLLFSPFSQWSSRQINRYPPFRKKKCASLSPSTPPKWNQQKRETWL